MKANINTHGPRPTSAQLRGLSRAQQAADLWNHDNHDNHQPSTGENQ